MPHYMDTAMGRLKERQVPGVLGVLEEAGPVVLVSILCVCVCVCVCVRMCMCGVDAQ